MSRGFDARSFRRAMGSFLDALRAHEDEINSLNVYPVPDGDTGTNLLLTQQAVVDALRPVDDDAVAEAVARSSLMGARGNSGVILSQVLRGMAEALGTEEPRPELAFRRASELAELAVARPAEGTMLSVLRAAAEAAAASGATSAAAVVDAALDAARSALERTPEQLPELAEAGVVDAGGRGIVLLLDAFRATLREEPLSEPPVRHGPVSSGPPHVLSMRGPAFEVQFLLEANDERAVAGVRRDLERRGESLVVVGSPGLYGVHVHTDDPGAAVAAAERAGTARDVSIVDLRRQVTSCMAGHARAVRVAEHQACALLAVAEGSGLARAFASLGAVVVEGGPGQEPSFEDISRAVDAAPSEDVVVLPNHPNVAASAARAAGASRKRVAVVRSASVPAGLAAATAFNPADDLEDNERTMSKAAERVRAGEIVRAERDGRTPGGAVREGEWLGMVEGRAVSAGRALTDTALAVAADLLDQDAELLTVVVGADASDEERDGVVEALRRSHPTVEVQSIEGRQPLHPFLLGAE